MIESYCNRCRVTFTFTTIRERASWFNRHPRSHKVDRKS